MQKTMRIKIIGDNNCARATRHLLRKAGFAVTEFLPADVVTQPPHFGYAIAIDLAPATHPPDPTSRPDQPPSFAKATAGLPAHAGAHAGLPAAGLAKAGRHTAKHGEALPSQGGASSPASPGARGTQ